MTEYGRGPTTECGRDPERRSGTVRETYRTYRLSGGGGTQRLHSDAARGRGTTFGDSAAITVYWSEGRTQPTSYVCDASRRISISLSAAVQGDSRARASSARRSRGQFVWPAHPHLVACHVSLWPCFARGLCSEGGSELPPRYHRAPPSL